MQRGTDLVILDAPLLYEAGTAPPPNSSLNLTARVVAFVCSHLGRRVVLSIADAGLHRLTSSVVVVYAPDDVQLKRLMKRDNIDEKEARQKIQAQMPLGIVCAVRVVRAW
jgi:hypothetical protein